MAKKRLVEKQWAFTHAVQLLIAHTDRLGMDLSFGDAYRDPRVHGRRGSKKSYSHRNSLHKSRLAVDFNLFIDGKYQRKAKAYIPLGQYWLSLNPDARWSIKDANHFSFTHFGMAY